MYKTVQTCTHCGANLSLDDMRRSDCPYCGTVYPHYSQAAQHAQMASQMMNNMVAQQAQLQNQWRGAFGVPPQGGPGGSPPGGAPGPGSAPGYPGAPGPGGAPGAPGYPGAPGAPGPGNPPGYPGAPGPGNPPGYPGGPGPGNPPGYHGIPAPGNPPGYHGASGSPYAQPEQMFATQMQSAQHMSQSIVLVVVAIGLGALLLIGGILAMVMLTV